MPGFFDESFFDPEFFGGSSIGAGTQQAFRTSKGNYRYGYWLDGGAIKGDARDAADNVVVPEFTVVASGVDDSSLAMKESFLHGGLWRVVLFYTAGGSLQERHSYDGENFS